LSPTLAQFAGAEGRKSGKLYTPRYVVTLLVRMLEPYRGHVYDPCCSSSEMFMHSEQFGKKHQGALTLHTYSHVLPGMKGGIGDAIDEVLR
jgi:type I restriction-modification system DNA methylase subunit